MSDLSIIIPAYNEERRLPAMLASIETFVSGASRSVEVIVVDDGSTDGTSEIAKSFGVAIPDLTVIRLPDNRGKGSAVRHGMLAATGRLRLFTDADGATPIGELAKLEAGLAAAGNCGVAFGSIATKEHVARGESAIRSAAGRFGNWLIQRIVLNGVRDSQRGFKLFTADAAEDLFGRSVINGWAFDVEVLTLAKRLGYPLIEIPTKWTHDPDTRVTALSYLTTLWEVLRIKWRVVRGRYDRLPAHSDA